MSHSIVLSLAAATSPSDDYCHETSDSRFAVLCSLEGAGSRREKQTCEPFN